MATITLRLKVRLYPTDVPSWKQIYATPYACTPGPAVITNIVVMGGGGAGNNGHQGDPGGGGGGGGGAKVVRAGPIELLSDTYQDTYSIVGGQGGIAGAGDDTENGQACSITFDGVQTLANGGEAGGSRVGGAGGNDGLGDTVYQGGNGADGVDGVDGAGGGGGGSPEGLANAENASGSSGGGNGGDGATTEVAAQAGGIFLHRGAGGGGGADTGFTNGESGAPGYVEFDVAYQDSPIIRGGNDNLYGVGPGGVPHTFYPQ